MITSEHMRRCFFVEIFIIGLILCSTASSLEAVDKPDGDLARRIILLNQQARDEIKSAEYEFKITRTRTKADLSRFSTSEASRMPVRESIGATVWRRGNWIATDLMEDSSLLDGSHASRELRSFVNDHTAAFETVGGSDLQAYDYDTLQQMPHDSKGLKDLFQDRDLLLFGFGDGFISLGDLLNLPNSPFRWSATSSNVGGRECYVLDQFNGDTRVASYRVDPDKGCGVVECTVFDGTSTLRHTNVKFVETGLPSIWYPQMVEEEWYGAGLPCEHTAISVSRFVVNREIEESRFNYDGLKLPEGIYVHRIDLAGKDHTGISVDGKVTDFASFQKLKYLTRRAEKDINALAHIQQNGPDTLKIALENRRLISSRGWFPIMASIIALVLSCLALTAWRARKRGRS